MTTTKKLVLLLLCLQLAYCGYAQDGHLSSRKGASSVGVGIGLPYGGLLGLRGGTNVIDRLNLFGALGYQLAGIGFNVGLRKEFTSASLTQFYMVGMYGTNAATKVKGLPEYNDVYTGPTFGLGVKINSRMTEGNYWDIGLLLPIRSSKYSDTEQAIKNDPRISTVTSAWPVLITVGYNFIIPPANQAVPK